MKRMRRPLSFAAILCLALLCGCANDGAGIKLAPVTGRVTFKNQAFTPGEIFFTPDEAKGTQGEPGNALLKPEDGTFTITTLGPKGLRDGVAPGSYRVTVGLGRRPDKELAKYRSAKTTPLSIEVPEEGYADIVVDLDKGTVVVK